MVSLCVIGLKGNVKLAVFFFKSVYFMTRLSKLSFHLIELIVCCRLTGKVELAAYFIQICVLHASEESQYARHPRSLFIAIFNCLRR